MYKIVHYSCLLISLWYGMIEYNNGISSSHNIAFQQEAGYFYLCHSVHFLFIIRYNFSELLSHSLSIQIWEVTWSLPLDFQMKDDVQSREFVAFNNDKQFQHKIWKYSCFSSAPSLINEELWCQQPGKLVPTYLFRYDTDIKTYRSLLNY